MSIKKLGVLGIALLLVLTLYPSFTISAIYISQGSAVHLSDDPGDERHPVVERLPNGNLLAVWSDGPNDVGAQFIEGKISTDDGVSWGSEFQIFPFGGGGDDGTMDKDPELFVTPNGTVALFIRDLGATTYDRNFLRCLLSYDNATTWNDMGQVGLDFYKTWDLARFVGGDTYGSTMYFCGESWVDVGDCYKGTSFWKSEDNCQSFTLINPFINTSTQKVDEWDIKCLNSTHFIGVSRDLDDAKTFWLETYDAGVTWSVSDYTSTMVAAGMDPGIINDPDMDWLNEDHGVIILHGRCQRGNDRCGYLVSSDYGVSWTNYTHLFSNNYGDEYTGFAEYSGESYGYLVYSGEDDIYGRMIYDLTTYPSDTTDYTVPFFVSINSGENESSTVIGTRDYVGNRVTLDDGDSFYAYNIQISNSSSFSSIFVDINNINGSEYSSSIFYQNTSCFFFNDSNSIQDYGGSYGSHYYRYRVGYRTVTE